MEIQLRRQLTDRCTPQVDWVLQSHQVSSTYCRIPTTQGRCTSPIKLSATEPHYTRSVSHIAERQHSQDRCTPLLIETSATEPYDTDIPRADVPPTNQTQCHIALQHHISITYYRMLTYPGQMYPPLIEPSATEPYNTDIPRADISPTNCTYCYRVLLHKISFISRSIQKYQTNSKSYIFIPGSVSYLKQTYQ